MKAHEMKVGTAVVDADGFRAMVIGNQLSDGDETVALEYPDSTLCKYNVNDLKVLDIEFEEFILLVSKKIEKAAMLLSEANALAEERGRELRDLEYDGYLASSMASMASMDPIMTELRRAGWLISSMGC
jgi:hypothetical protein